MCVCGLSTFPEKLAIRLYSFGASAESLAQYRGVYPSGLQPHWPHSANTLIDYSLN